MTKYIINNKNIVFIVSIFNVYEQSQYNFDRFIKYFKDCHINFSYTNLIDVKMQIDVANTLLKNVNTYLCWGENPELQMKSINEYQFYNMIKKRWM